MGSEQRVSLKVRVGRPNGARERYCDGTTGRVQPVYRCAWPLIVGRESYQNHESRAIPRAHARQGKETVHLVGNRALWRDDREGTDGMVVLAADRCPLCC